MSFNNITNIKNIPRILSEYIDKNSFKLCTSKITSCSEAPETKDKKFIIELQDMKLVESVLIVKEFRNTLCVSCQIGCMMKCSFCATGTMGFNGDLTTGEIIEQ